MAYSGLVRICESLLSIHGCKCSCCTSSCVDRQVFGQKLTSSLPGALTAAEACMHVDRHESRRRCDGCHRRWAGDSLSASAADFLRFLLLRLCASSAACFRNGATSSNNSTQAHASANGAPAHDTSGILRASSSLNAHELGQLSDKASC